MQGVGKLGFGHNYGINSSETRFGRPGMPLFDIIVAGYVGNVAGLVQKCWR